MRRGSRWCQMRCSATERDRNILQSVNELNPQKGSSQGQNLALSYVCRVHLTLHALVDWDQLDAAVSSEVHPGQMICLLDGGDNIHDTNASILLNKNDSWTWGGWTQRGSRPTQLQRDFLNNPDPMNP